MQELKINELKQVSGGWGYRRWLGCPRLNRRCPSRSKRCRYCGTQTCKQIKKSDRFFV
ncbi:bacteriocin [Neisseria chenwenguii]|nr:bacteriocin [Neisseria chenwenguii]